MYAYNVMVNQWLCYFKLPVDMKNGTRNFPESTLDLRLCSELPSNGKAPQTSTYSTTPRL